MAAIAARPSATAAPLSAASASSHKRPGNSGADPSKALVRYKQLVPDPAHGLNGVTLKPVIQPGSQAADVTLDHAGTRIEVDIPDVLQEHLAGDDPICMPHQVFEQAEFLRQQLD